MNIDNITDDSLIIVVLGTVLGIVVGLATVMRAYIANCQWDSFLSQYGGSIQIESGKEGIQPKHNVKPKFIQIKKPFQKFIRNEIKDKNKINNNVKYNVNDKYKLSIGKPDLADQIRTQTVHEPETEQKREEYY